MLTPIELIKAVVDGMIARGFGRIVNITSSSVKAPIDVLGLSNGARSGLTGFVAGVARTTVKHNVTINNLLPGVFDTDRIQATLDSMAKKMNCQGRGHETPCGGHSGRAHGYAHGIRSGMRLSVQHAGRVRHRAEFSD